jgi:ribose-phosphate pyrophosphokinase
MNAVKIFGLGVSQSYADQVCRSLGESRATHREAEQDDGEPYVLSGENVRGCDVFVISSLYNCEKERLGDKVIKLLFFARSLRDASAKRITLVMPYLAYQRQDRKTESRAPVYTKYLPEMVESLLRPDDRILTMDAHNLSAFQSGFRLMIDHLEAKTLVTDWVVRNLREFDDVDLDNLCWASPDTGGVKRTGYYRERAETLLGVKIGNAAVYKSRRGQDVEAYGVMGDVRGKSVFIFDDMISSGKTLVKGLEAIEKEGGKVAAAIATHGLFVGNANENIAKLVDRGVRVVVTDTVEPFRLNADIRSHLTVIPTAPLFAEAIRCIHNEESISRLLQ